MNKFSLKQTLIDGLTLITRKPVIDDRGQFDKLFCLDDLQKELQLAKVAQINHSRTNDIGTIRGLHFQLPPYSEMKIVCCIKGAVFDVAVDIRKNSPTFLKWHGEILSAENLNSLLIPKGFAHGFQTLNENSELIYIHTQPFKKEYEACLNATDPNIGIEWPRVISNRSRRDKSQKFIDSQFKGIVV